MGHYSFTDPRDGWLSWPCWLTDSGRLNCKVIIQLAVWRRIGKVRRPRPAFWPLCYAANRSGHACRSRSINGTDNVRCSTRRHSYTGITYILYAVCKNVIGKKMIQRH